MYDRPSWLDRRLSNPLMRLAVGTPGRDIDDVRLLEVPRRLSGRWQRTPVKVLTIGDSLFLVSLRGESDWVRNLRASRRARLRLGRHITEVTATEVPEEERPRLLRAYLNSASREATRRLLSCPADRDEHAWFRELAVRHPAFRLEPAAPSSTLP